MNTSGTLTKGLVEQRSAGRPREFEIGQVLDKAIDVFREKGYHATSIRDLSEAMGLVSGSIYKAFRDKRAVFLAAFERYLSNRRSEIQKVLKLTDSGREKLRSAIAFYAESSSGAQGRRGCLVVASAIELSAFDAEIARLVKDALATNEKLLAALILQGQADGSINTQIDPATTARLMLCLLQGMRVVGKAGRTRADMSALIDLATRILD